MSPVILSLRPEDAEPILRQAAKDAALWGGRLDHCPRRCWNSPKNNGETIEQARERWRGKFLAAKRTVEAFGVSVEGISEAECVGVHYPHYKGQKSRILDLPTIGKVRIRSGGTPIKSRPEKIWRDGPYRAACDAAAERVVVKWRGLVGAQAAA